MKIAIHSSKVGFSNDWISYCQLKGIDFKIVNCYDNNIIDQVQDCDILMWHHHHTESRDFLFAKQLLYAIQHSGKHVFPDFKTGWHFDDKLGQKYLLESIEAPLVKSYVFYDKLTAFNWVRKTTFPKVFKLRGGAGSTNVKLINSKFQAQSIIKKAFNKGFTSYNKLEDLKENFRKFQLDKANWKDILKSVRRLFFSTRFAKTIGSQKGYVLFQDFIPNNDSDIRVVTIGNKAFAIKRLVRTGDFRASGSGFIQYNKELIDIRCIQIAFETSDKLNAQVVAYDFVFDMFLGQPLIVEINYGFAHEAYFKCPGYWDRELNWHEGNFNSANWIIDLIIENYK